MMAVLHEDSFHVFSLREDYRCTPQSVAPHTLYENADPFELKEPSGTLRTNNARYEAISDRAVRVSGSEFVQDPEYTIKLEGVRDPYTLSDSWLARLDDKSRHGPATPSASSRMKSLPASRPRRRHGHTRAAARRRRWPRGIRSVGRDQ
jgi:hypothetical protein